MAKVDLTAESDVLVRELNNIKLELQRSHESLRQLTAQRSENESVRLEFDKLEPTSRVWKLTGPLMVLQETDEARSNVDKRIDYISKELISVELRIKGAEADFERKRGELVEIQTQIQSITKVSQ
jgi:prefoldin beta subunit